MDHSEKGSCCAMSKIPTYEELPIREGAPAHSAWGVWGDDDELGTLNFLTKDRIQAASSEIQVGERVTINWPYNLPKYPGFGRQPFKHEIVSKAPRPVHDDILVFNTQSGSQWDGLRHYGCPHKGGSFYNGVTPELVMKGDSLRNGIHVMAEAGIAGRGVLIDYYSYAKRHGIEYDPQDTHAVTVEDIEKVREEQGLEFKKGDILLIRVGYTARYYTLSDEALKDISTRQPVRFAGVDRNMNVIKWLWDNQFSAVGSDSPSWEVQPMADWSLHEYILGGFGCPIAELLDLEKLAEVCEREKRWSFFFTATPLNVPGGIASPTNAMCLL